MKRYIRGMASSRKDVAANLEQGVDVLIMHLIKLRLLPDAQEVPHWRKEVAEKLHRTDLLKGSHKIPSAQFIFDNTYKCNAGFIPHLIDVVIDDYLDSIATVDYESLQDDIKEYFNWISQELSMHRIISYKAIQTKLEELGF